MTRLRPLLAVVALLVALMGSWRAGAEGPDGGGEESTSTSVEDSPPTTADALPAPPTSEPLDRTTTTTDGSSGGPGDTSSTTTTTSTTAKTTGSDPATDPTDVGDGDGDGGGSGASTTPRTIPAEAERLIRSVRRTRPNNTAALLTALRPMTAYGFSEREANILGMGRFPVAGFAKFSDDWWNPRFVPFFHLHVGTDVFAAMGTPVRSPVDGAFRSTNGPVGGLGAYVTLPDRTFFYLAHLSALAPGLHAGQKVKTGQVIGYVGNTGNAAGGPAHLHLELHPRGLGPVNPKPYLDKFITDAMIQAPAWVAYAKATGTAAVPAPAVATTAVALPDPVRPNPPSAVEGSLAWLASMSPVAGPVALARAEVADAAAGLDWDHYAKAEAATRRARDAVRSQVRALLGPITPAALVFTLG